MKINAEVSIERIGPEEASDMLQELHDKQRRIRQSRVDAYAQEMLNGSFKLSPDAIVIAKGKLANGQHRLQAVVQSGKPHTFLVLKTSDEDIFKVTDNVMPRNIGDAMDNKEYAKDVPAVAGYVYAYDNCNGDFQNYRKTLPRTAFVEYCDSNHGIFSDALRVVSSAYEETRLLSKTLSAALYVLGSRIDGAKSLQFIQDVLVNGGQNVAGDLRNRLIQQRGSKTQIKRQYLFGLCVKALAYYMKDVRPKPLKWVNDEPFPRL